jgi:hypothetical protein
MSDHARMANRSDERPPWKRKNPQKKKSATLTAAQRGEARARARAAGRTYPNLVDNMAVARAASKKPKAAKAKKAKRTTAATSKRAAARRGKTTSR